ncbi:hypothetical protein [uncultured Tateyamaria sp.]|uniref:hypothetical protein n=1 Tax=uncultured Tateyamaria sp. TaxID=455651 RepID=UPI0026030CA7|nr:hypothetical protein [uncultured Tateyamaria sp.]
MDSDQLNRFVKIMEMRRYGLGLSHNDLAIKAEISDVSYTQGLAKKRIVNPRVSTIYKIKTALEVPDEEWRWVFGIDMAGLYSAAPERVPEMPYVSPADADASLPALDVYKGMRKSGIKKTDSSFKNRLGLFLTGLEKLADAPDADFAGFELELAKWHLHLAYRENLEEREGYLQEAKAHLDSALRRADKDTHSLLWADIHNYLGMVKMELGFVAHSDEGTTYEFIDRQLREAISLITVSKEQREKIKNYVGVAHSHLFEGIATLELGIRHKDREIIGDSVQLFRDAERLYDRYGRKDDASHARGETARALMEQSVFSNDEDGLEVYLLYEARGLFDTTISYEWQEQNLFRYAELQSECGKLFERLANLESEAFLAHFQEALGRYETALSQFTQTGTPFQYAIAKRRLKRLQESLKSKSS